jgi:hypothetical protein
MFMAIQNPVRSVLVLIEIVFSALLVLAVALWLMG